MKEQENRITVKELYRELVELRAEVKFISNEQGLGKKYYTRLLLVILATILCDIVLHLYLHVLAK